MQGFTFKNLIINAMKELNEMELREVEGGWLIPLLVGAVIAGILSDWPGFKQGIIDGMNGN